MFKNLFNLCLHLFFLSHFQFGNFRYGINPNTCTKNLKALTTGNVEMKH